MHVIKLNGIEDMQNKSDNNIKQNIEYASENQNSANKFSNIIQTQNNDQDKNTSTEASNKLTSALVFNEWFNFVEKSKNVSSAKLKSVVIKPQSNQNRELLILKKKMKKNTIYKLRTNLDKNDAHGFYFDLDELLDDAKTKENIDKAILCAFDTKGHCIVNAPFNDVFHLSLNNSTLYQKRQLK